MNPEVYSGPKIDAAIKTRAILRIENVISRRRGKLECLRERHLYVPERRTLLSPIGDKMGANWKSHSERARTTETLRGTL